MCQHMGKSILINCLLFCQIEVFLIKNRLIFCSKKCQSFCHIQKHFISHYTKDSHYLMIWRNCVRSHFVTMKHLPTRQKDETDKMLIFSSLINIQLQYIFIISLQLSPYQYSIISEANEACIINCSMKVIYNHICSCYQIALNQI